ncbi:MAG TPA: L,D-transpeptidase family protein [Xanthobacteraceae bacterium]|nr:L,D-transpeptidase family protein [Xanthobacteraceae bacterium]
MPGIRVDRLLASTAIALLLALPTTGTFAGSENGPAADASATPPQESQADNANKPAVSQKASDDAPAATTKPGETAAPASNSAEKPTDEAKPGAASNATPAPAPAGQAVQSAGGEARPDAKPAPSTETAQPGEGAKSAAEGKPTETKPAETKPADAKPSDTAVTSAPATASPEAATAAATVAQGPDAAIAEQLRELGNGKFDRIIGSKKDRTQIEVFYSSRNYAPLWIADGKPTARATAAIGYLRHVDADGLDPADYPVPNFEALSAPADLADAEIKLTAAVVTYAHHASVGRVHWSRVSADIEYSTPVADPGDILAAIAGASDVVTTLDSYEPQTPGYRALKAKLADIRAGKIDKSKPPIAGGPVLKVGMADERVPALRERLGVTGNDGNTYDKTLAEAVKKFQQQHDLSATGTLGAATLDALNGRAQPERVTDVIIANMERWRWMPHRFADTYVIVNLPDFTLRVMHDGKQLWTTRIVIGKPEMPTPIMTAEMKYITVNPTWNVPPSIVNHEYLPALAQDPTVLERMGLHVDRNADGSIHIYQPPGDKNALGRIRFNFPNKFLVYQHDTPDKYMFAYDKRAFSHGCMRVQDPVHYAEVLLSLVRPSDGYTEDRIRRMFGSSENDIQFPTFIPVNLTYQTAFVDDAGKLELREDIYGRDRALLAILKGTDRKVADVPVEHKIDASHREVMAIPDEPSWFGGRSPFGGGRGYPGGGSYYGGGNFFSRLFGGFSSAPPVPPAPMRHHSADRPRKVTHSGQTMER